MSNSKIIAICSDSPISAQSDNGVNWAEANAESQRWKIISRNYNLGVFSYAMIDSYNPYALVSYSTVDDGITWTAGILPTPSLDCIVAIAEDLPGIVTSFNGVSFDSVGIVSDVNYSREYGSNKIYQTCFAHSLTTSSFWSAVNCRLFFATCIAVSQSSAIATIKRCKIVTGTAVSYSKGFFDRVVTYRRTLTATASSIVSFVRSFLW